MENCLEKQRTEQGGMEECKKIPVVMFQETGGSRFSGFLYHT